MLLRRQLQVIRKYFTYYNVYSLQSTYIRSMTHPTLIIIIHITAEKSDN